MNLLNAQWFKTLLKQDKNNPLSHELRSEWPSTNIPISRNSESLCIHWKSFSVSRFYEPHHRSNIPSYDLFDINETCIVHQSSSNHKNWRLPLRNEFLQHCCTIQEQTCTRVIKRISTIYGVVLSYLRVIHQFSLPNSVGPTIFGNEVFQSWQSILIFL